MELHADEPGVVRDLDDLRQLAVRRQAGEQQARLLQHLPVVDVHLVAVAVALADRIRAVDVAHPGAFLEDAGIGAEAPGAAEVALHVAPLALVAARPPGHPAAPRIAGPAGLGAPRPPQPGPVETGG